MSSQGSYKREVEGGATEKEVGHGMTEVRLEGFEKGVMSQGMQAPLEAGKDKEMDFPLEPQKEPACPHLDCSPLSESRVRLLSSRTRRG